MKVYKAVSGMFVAIESDMVVYFLRTSIWLETVAKISSEAEAAADPMRAAKLSQDMLQMLSSELVEQSC